MDRSESGRRKSVPDDQKFQLLVNSITDCAVYMLDPDGLVSSWNPGAQRLKGYRADEIIGNHFSCFYTAEDRVAGIPARALVAALAGGIFEAEGWRVRKDGSSMWARVVIHPIRDESGAHVGFAKITRDLSEQRAATEALRESERGFRLLVQGVTDYAIYRLSVDGVVTSWNQGAQRIKGYAADEIVGQHFSRFYPEADRAAGVPDRALRRAREEGRYETEGWRVRKDGSRFWASVVIDPVHDDDGSLVGFAKVTRDLTERKRAQDALEEARASLHQAQKMEAVGQLTGGIAHDFNNLLQAIAGCLEMIGRRSDDPKVAVLLDAGQQAVERGARLIQQLMAFARRQALRPEPVAVGDRLLGMQELLRRALPDGIALHTDIAERLWTATVDPTQMELAILNLAVNARDAMPGGGSVIVRAANTALDPGSPLGLAGEFVRLSVADTGTGMPDAVRERAFDPFFTTKEVGKGSGLGLSQVYGFARQSGGTAWIESVEGKGTTVHLLLPRSPEAPPAEPPAMRGCASAR